ncbi:hypothetical protein [Aeromicrobium sp. HA]|uniref:hypothetical protein n=1 Tax=Aeromicrobium sp. HA TaxID=3009077 RepID=UPI0022AE94E7|nr:hypothetical protein [Aeromicrobium sp. HA]
MNAVELAKRWDTTTGRLANMRSGGTGPHYFKIGTRVLYRIDDVLAFEEQNMVVTAGAA